MNTPSDRQWYPCGAIEQDADIVMCLHRPDVYNPDDRPGLAEIVLVKHCFDATGTVNLQ